MDYERRVARQELFGRIKERVEQLPVDLSKIEEFFSADGVVVHPKGSERPILLVAGMPDQPFEILSWDKDGTHHIKRVRNEDEAVREMKNTLRDRNLLTLDA